MVCSSAAGSAIPASFTTCTNMRSAGSRRRGHGGLGPQHGRGRVVRDYRSAPLLSQRRRLARPVLPCPFSLLPSSSSNATPILFFLFANPFPFPSSFHPSTSSSPFFTTTTSTPRRVALRPSPSLPFSLPFPTFPTPHPPPFPPSSPNVRPPPPPPPPPPPRIAAIAGVACSFSKWRPNRARFPAKIVSRTLVLMSQQFELLSVCRCGSSPVPLSSGPL